MNLDECFEKRLLRKISIIKEKSKKSLLIAEKRLKEIGKLVET